MHLAGVCTLVLLCCSYVTSAYDIADAGLTVAVRFSECRYFAHAYSQAPRLQGGWLFRVRLIQGWISY